jgi:hypothetical protein
MGTLFAQRPRQEKLGQYTGEVWNVLKEMMERQGLEWSDVTPDHWRAAAAVTEAGLRIQSADVLDEQLAGFGELLEDLNGSLSRITDQLAEDAEARSQRAG